MKQSPVARDLRCGEVIVSGKVGFQAGASVDVLSGIPCVVNGVNARSQRSDARNRNDWTKVPEGGLQELKSHQNRINP